MKKSTKKIVITLLCVIAGSFILALNINTFVHAGGLFPGGFTGLTLFVQRVFVKYFQIELPYSIINITLNLIPAGIAFKFVGKRFAIFSCLSILLVSLFVSILPVINITEDILLIAVFGGIINGISMCILLKGNASSGGTDFIALWISKYTKQSSWNYILAMNAVLLFFAGLLFGWDKALYSIFFQFCSTTILNTLYHRYKKVTLFIVTSNPQAVVDVIWEATHHGVTRLEGVGTYSNKERPLLYTVIGSGELKELMIKIHQADADAFINVTKSELVDGRFYLQPIE